MQIDMSKVPDPRAPGVNFARTEQEHRQQVGRHREHFEKEATPEEFWNMGFPTSQEVAERNKARGFGSGDDTETSPSGGDSE